MGNAQSSARAQGQQGQQGGQERTDEDLILDVVFRTRSQSHGRVALRPSVFGLQDCCRLL